MEGQRTAVEGQAIVVQGVEVKKASSAVAKSYGSSFFSTTSTPWRRGMIRMLHVPTPQGRHFRSVDPVELAR